MLSAKMRIKKNIPKYRTSMLARLLIPMFFVFVIQIAVIIFMFLNSGILDESADNAYSRLAEKVFNRKQYIENEVLDDWLKISDLSSEILDILTAAIANENIRTADIIKREDIQEKIYEDILPELVYFLNKSTVTGVFFVFDSSKPSGENIDVLYPGIYLRKSCKDTASVNDDELLLFRGSKKITEDYNIVLDSYWRQFFVIPNLLSDIKANFFHCPIEAAKLVPYAPASNLCYWSLPFKLKPNTDVITYSFPLKDSEGNIYGVLGIDLSIDALKSLLPFEELYKQNKGTYCIAYRNKNSGLMKFTPICVNGVAADLTSSQFPELETVKTEYDNIYTIENSMLLGARQCTAIEEISLYPKNAFYENQEWVLMGIVAERTILSFPFTLIKVFLQGLLVAGILFYVGAYLSSKHISNMLTNVILKIENSDITKPLQIEKMNITEFDALLFAIENLSRGLFNAASRVSKIIEQLQVPIGVFEHNTILGTVFCNSIWFKLFNIQKYSGDTFLNDMEFYQMLTDLEYYIHSQEENMTIYAIPTGEPGKVRWIRFTGMKENEKFLGIAVDITRETEDRTRMEMQMNYDDLTGLYNRTAFDKKMTKVFKEKYLGICALVMWDVDNLKYINDTFGHTYGDSYLQIFGKKLSSLQQDRCLVCRRSGDEFYTFFYGFSTSDEIRLLLNSFWKEMQNMTIILPNGEETRLRVSAGISWYPYDADNQTDLIRYADFAIYDVKHSFKGSLHDFDLDMYKKNYILIRGTEALNQMFEKNLIEYAMQPIVVAATGEIYGYEMLMRSMMSEFKSPEDILRLARAQSKLHLLEEVSIFAAMETFTSKVKKGEIPKTAKVFLNTISSQILSTIKLDEFEEKYKPYLSNIVLEITESEPLNTAIYAVKSERIQSWNAMIAIDDFGSGYSNDSSLVFLSPNLVKIDMSIVRNIHKSLDKQNLLENLISYAKKRDIIVLAEGVEVIEEIDVLLRFGVDLFQGYFFAKPAFTVQPIQKASLKTLQDCYSGGNI